jgi:TraM recognition site of TraD and TraG
MLERILSSKTFVSFVLAAATAIVLAVRYPFPSGNLVLQLISLKDHPVYLGIFWAYSIMLFSTPYFIYSAVLSGIYVFAYGHGKKIKPIPLPPYPAPAKRQSLFLVIGELHHPTKVIASPVPQWLSTPERGLYAGKIYLGAVGSGKTTCGMRPDADQLIGYQASDPACRIGGLVLEVKGDFCHQVQEIMTKYEREGDYIEISLNSEYRWNPFENELDSYALAYNIASLLNNLFGKGKEPFWQQAYTNLVKFVILLHKVVYDYVTPFHVYECVISPSLLARRIEDGDREFPSREFILIDPDAFKKVKEKHEDLAANFQFDPYFRKNKAERSRDLEQKLDPLAPEIRYEIHREPLPQTDPIKWEHLESVRRWYKNDWMQLETKLRTSIVEGISVFLSLFDDPHIKKIFCPPKETYDPQLNIRNEQGQFKYGTPLPSFSWLIENGKVCALNLPISMNAGLARAIGTMMKMDFQRAVLQRIPKMERNRDQHFRPVFFLCDEYQTFATVGENEPLGDEKFFSVSRQAKCIAIVATQSISSLRSSLPGESWRTLLQTFRTKIFLALSDEFSTKIAAELCGQEDKPFINYTITESGQDAGVGLFTGKTTSEKESISASKNYSLRRDFRFTQKMFAELATAQAIVIPYDGTRALESTICYLKPYYIDPNISYFEQVRRGQL